MELSNFQDYWKARKTCQLDDGSELRQNQLLKVPAEDQGDNNAVVQDAKKEYQIEKFLRRGNY